MFAPNQEQAAAELVPESAVPAERSPWASSTRGFIGELLLP